MFTSRIAKLSVALISGALLALAVSTPQRAHADRYELSIGSSTNMMSSESVDALTEDNLPLFAMTAAMAIDGIRIPFVDRFYIDGAFDAGSASGTSFQTLSTSTSLMHWSLGARVQRDLSPRVAVNARAAMGLARVDVTIEDRFMDGPTLGDGGYTGTSYLGMSGDVALLKPKAARKAHFNLALRAEVGYLAMLPKTLEARPDGSDHQEGAILIPELSASLGDVNLSAWNVRFGLVGRF